MVNSESRVRQLKVCYFGTYRRSYSRNKILIGALRQAQVEVYECHSKLWLEFEDREHVARGGWVDMKIEKRCANQVLALQLALALAVSESEY